MTLLARKQQSCALTNHAWHSTAPSLVMRNMRSAQHDSRCTAQRISVCVLAQQGSQSFIRKPRKHAETGEERQQQRERRRRKQLKREKMAHAAISLARTDLKYSQPPWLLPKTATAAEMELDRFISSLSEHADNMQREVSVLLTVDPVPSGFFVSGRAKCNICLPCAFCLKDVPLAVNGTFDVFVNCKLEDRDACEVNEVPFPDGARAADLTDDACAALANALPTMVLCDGANCCHGGADVASSSESMVWTADAIASDHTSSLNILPKS